MFEIVNNLSLSASESIAILGLLQDNECQLDILKAMGKRLLENNNVMIVDPIGQIMITVSVAPFADSQEECLSISQIILWGLKTKDIIPMISEHQGKELANRCLISLSFFRKTMEKRTNRYGSPSPNFYREIGMKTFKQIGENEIGNHFEKWEGFLQEMFT